MRALITGIGGFVGGHLASLLLREGFEVWGIDRVPVSADLDWATVAVELGDVCDAAFMDRIVRAARPTHVFHLATAIGPNIGAPSDPTDANVIGVSVLLEAIRAAAPQARVMIASSSAAYGANDRHAIDEDTPAKPTTSYGASKLAVEGVAASFRFGRGMDVLVTRTFNLLGPGMPRRLFAGSLAAQIAAAEHLGSSATNAGGAETGQVPSIKVGRLDSSRDYLDVRDAARAYLALATQRPTDNWVFNVCSGVAHSGRQLADEMLALARAPVRLDYDASRLQAGDVDYQCGSAARLQQATGWTPTIAFSASVRDTLEHERKRAG